MIGLKKNSFLLHIFAWLIYASVFFFLNLEVTSLSEAGRVFTRLLSIIPIQVAVFYFNANFLMPRYFERNKFWTYAGFVIIILVVVTLSNYFLFQLEKSINPEIAYRARPTGLKPGKSIFYGRFFINGFIILSVLFVSTVFRTIKVKREKERREAQIKSEKLQADIQFLKEQINPHFLFNALNNIYSLAILKKEQAPEAIHKLSEILRYVIYESNTDQVPLSKEVKYLKNYISLQQLRDEELSRVRIEISGDMEGKLIAPMILIPFVENSFKHSNLENDPDGKINIQLNLKNNRMSFFCENTVPKVEISKGNTGGIGHENVKKRIELIYGKKHRLEIFEGKGIYTVNLILKLDED